MAHLKLFCVRLSLTCELTCMSSEYTAKIKSNATCQTVEYHSDALIWSDIWHESCEPMPLTSQHSHILIGQNIIESEKKTSRINLIMVQLLFRNLFAQLKGATRFHDLDRVSRLTLQVITHIQLSTSKWNYFFNRIWLTPWDQPWSAVYRIHYSPIISRQTSLKVSYIWTMALESLLYEI